MVAEKTFSAAKIKSLYQAAQMWATQNVSDAGFKGVGTFTVPNTPKDCGLVVFAADEIASRTLTKAIEHLTDDHPLKNVPIRINCMGEASLLGHSNG